MHSEFLILSIIWLAVLIPTAVFLWRQRDHRASVVLTYLIFCAISYALKARDSCLMPRLELHGLVMMSRSL